MTLQLSDKAQFALEFIDLEEAAGISNISWEPFQIGFLNNEKRFGIDVKARQIAWSFTAALDAVVDGLDSFNPGTPHVFVSINQDEAKEKVRYARAVVEAIDGPVRPKLVRDSQLALEFENGSRLISHPCRPPRGKPRARVYLDEMAHYKEGTDREIYRAALPATTKGDGYIRIGSSPLGASGLFWEIATESLRPYPGYNEWRRFIPWWKVHALCMDVPLAVQMAPGMPTEDRVRAFGMQALVELFENMFLEDFQQEFECDWVDESIAWIPWDIIKRLQSQDLRYYKAKSVHGARSCLRQLVSDVSSRQVEQTFTGGIDIGRLKMLTEFFVIGKASSGKRPTRFMVSLEQTKYDAQFDCFAEVIGALPFSKVLIDQNGIGSQLAENLSTKFPTIVEGVDFTNATRETWAVESRLQAERGNAVLPPERDVAYQIHAIKRHVTPSKNTVYDAARNQKHHADKFWAWSLGLFAAKASSEAWMFWG